MTVENKFVRVMSKKTNNQLIKIVTVDIENYQPEAIDAAKIEMKCRKVSGKQIERVHRINEKKIIKAQKKAKESLDAIEIISLILNPLNVFSVATYENEGYKQKAEEAVNWSYWGFAFYALLFWVLLLLSNK